ncbi:hypothetical protein A3Q56_03748 [Intoshia linei]|uniref:Mitochondrial import receptor subunit TOM22 homolog n=1 Tax=Intoshia linei TaxID=1819745 RepID=A0A177B4G7_9BILA|nr:hypothetical protein A3Q56_03748 [Intoshia linei]
MPKLIEHDEPDETFSERFSALSEIFPKSVQNAFVYSNEKFKTIFNFSKNTLWVTTTTLSVLVLPFVVCNEYAAVHSQQRDEKNRVLFGPDAKCNPERPNLM